MLLNRNSKIGLFGKNNPDKTKELFIYDFNNHNKKALDNYSDWKAKGISRDGKKIAIITISPSTRAYRDHLIIMDHNNENILLDTHDYLIYDIEFNASGNQVLIIADKKKPFCYDLSLNKITAELPKLIRAYKGDLDIENDIFIAPCEKTKDTCYLFNFNNGKTETIKFGTKEIITRVKYSIDYAFLYLITNSNLLYCFDRNYKLKWSKDFNSLGKAGGRINASKIFSTEDGKYLAVEASSTETNQWGAEYVIDSENGEIIKQIEGYQFRGRFSHDFFDNKILLYKYGTIDLLSGEVSKNPIF